MGKNDIQETRQNLEDLFFRKEDQKLIEQFRAIQKMKETQETLAKVSGIRNEAILKKLVELNVRPETLVSLSLVPLIEIAWADGHVDAREKKAILSAVNQSKKSLGNRDHELLERWLNHRPPAQLLEAWIHFTRGLCERLSREEVTALKEEFIKQGRAIADASGGFFHLSGNISKAEAALLQKLESAFDTGG
ncbi:MAG: TerB family tellurite resistance protein [Verrucomicrobia bacterium]|nr:TerB family tellurite resistance protein [Verrucomicrobiota bacterium]MCG2680023.1 TerB family tellurite resistance protein [Kiritimatiellia bacterium]MBU4247312.1 TerB family tellurite resistance protein [Verrucomicrobiota bacterium]MBU4290683.1 TerB family tellurite resistance protein [Verrucomicrobiota bacterium]MBU4428874.1 TerB family tellurite resistance protein [Verrucomicrobiota bacterium]